MKPDAESASYDSRIVTPADSKRRQRLVIRGVMFVVVAMCLLLVLSHGLLASRFTADSAKIQSIAQGAAIYDDKAFMAVGRLYAVLGLANHSSLAGLVGFGLYVIVLWTVSGANHLEEAGWLTVTLICASLLLAAIYLGQYNKDFIELIATLIAGVKVRRHKLAREILLVIAMVLIAAYVRSYWILIVAVYIALRWVLSNAHRPRRLVIDVVAVYLGLAIAFMTLRHQPLNYGRVSVNDARNSMQLVVNTLITDPIPGLGFFPGLVNSMIVGLFLLIPLPLATSLQAAHVLVAGFVALMWISVLRICVMYARQNKVRDDMIERALALIFSMVLVQSLFEPDYGSYVRHLTPLLPLFVLLSSRARAVLPRRAAAGTSRAGSI